MTENKRYEYCRGKYRHYIQDIEKDGVWREGYIGTYGEFDLDKITVLLNELNDENKQLRKFIMDLQNMIQFDVDNGIKTYPKKLSEYLANALKVMLND